MAILFMSSSMMVRTVSYLKSKIQKGPQPQNKIG